MIDEDTVLDCSNATTSTTGCAVIASDPDGQWDPLTLSIFAQATSGTAAIVGDGTALLAGNS